VEKVPSLVGSAVDFAALASTTLSAKVLARKGCAHITEVQPKALADTVALGETSGTLHKSLRAFMGSVWAPFGRAIAKQLAEDRRVEAFFLALNFSFLPSPC
jgi:hypothetical protein